MDVGLPGAHLFQGTGPIGDLKTDRSPAGSGPETPQIHQQTGGFGAGVEKGKGGIGAIHGDDQGIAAALGAPGGPAPVDLALLFITDQGHAAIDHFEEFLIALLHRHIPGVVVKALAVGKGELTGQAIALQMKNTGGGIGGKGFQASFIQGGHDLVVVGKAEDGGAGQLLLEIALDIILGQHPDPVGHEILHTADGRQPVVHKDVGIGAGQGSAVIEIAIPLGIVEQPGMGIGPAISHHAQGFIPGSGYKIDGDAALLGPETPLIDNHTGGLAVVPGKVKRDAVHRIGHGDALHLGRFRRSRHAWRGPCQTDHQDGEDPYNDSNDAPHRIYPTPSHAPACRQAGIILLL